ncbi:MAG: S8 family serine peptidase [Phycisphaerae bacterium]|nr:S8 family serine peptidase [Phycisphaerae bacterium]
MKKVIVGLSIWMVLAVLLTAGVVSGDITGVKQVSKGASAPAHPLPEMFERGPSAKRRPEKYVPGEILVKLKKRSAAAKKLSALNEPTGLEADSSAEPSSFDQVLSRYSVTSVEPVFRHIKPSPPSKMGAMSAAPAEPVKPFRGAAERSDLKRWYRLKLPADVNEQDMMDLLKSDSEVETAELNCEWRLAVLPDAATDPGYVDQWHFANTHVREAWQFLDSNGINPGGSRDVVVAVIDTGVDYTHEDLVGNMWTNGGEIPGNDIDDDDNGFVDDIHGCSVVSDARSHSGDPVDLHGHGTHVAGIVAGTAYNGRGGVGVAFNVQVMAIRSAQYSGVLTVDDIAEGIMYAADNGAHVINMSFGGGHRSVIVEDALSIAFSRAVLVAAAGNSAVETEWAPNVPKAPHYPAALPWVLGVMASTPSDKLALFSNSDSCPKTRIEYEVAAPGTGIYSTIPGNRYAAWSGTSMAAPVVSGIAALLRSHFADAAVYSSRFIMGQIVGTANGIVVDANSALTDSPIPEVTMFENWLFDDDAIAAGNDGDGRIDAGETIHLAIELINRWGMADDLTVTLEAKAGVVGPDPYVTIDVNTVDYVGIGPFNTADNGFIYDANGVIVGVELPFVFTVDPNCPNDHLIPFVLTISYHNAWDPDDPTIYTHEERFYYPVQRGRDVPRVISEDMEMTSDDFWLITGPMLIEPQATLTIGPGTQVQWGGISDDPYNPGPQTGDILVRGKLLVEGTAEQPASFFPSYLVAGQTTNITAEHMGQCDLKYTKVRNPNITGISWIDHCYFDWDAYPSEIKADYISNTIFHRLWRDPLMRWGPPGPMGAGNFDTCLFAAAWQGPRDKSKLANCTFLQDNEEKHPISTVTPISYPSTLTNGRRPNGEAIFERVFYYEWYRDGFTYFLLPMEWISLDLAEIIAGYYGGHVASIGDAGEEAFLETYVKDNYSRWCDSGSYCIGLSDKDDFGNYRWTDGTPLSYTNWRPDHPIALPAGAEHIVRFAYCDRFAYYFGGWENMLAPDSTREEGGGPMHWNAFILKLPGVWREGDLYTTVENGDLLAYVRERQAPEVGYHVRHNAFLSAYWDPQLDHWMRIVAPINSHDEYCHLHENFWGTDSEILVDHAIWDYYDDFTSARIHYGTLPEHGYPSTYPFVERVLLNDQDAETVPIFGAEPVTFQVVFNRDMDPNIQPFVTFGPAEPYTDFLIGPVDDGWVDARTWEGSFLVNPMTGEGYHQMRISGAVDANDPWLVTGYDVGRFRFEVKTMGVAAMTLQASGGEGRVDLMWQQDDFDLLAGYNVYRSDTIDGTYERANATIIPVGSESYVDTDVIPAIPKYYKFTVVQTDLEESDFSNIASAAAVDTILPVIAHVPKTSAAPGLGLRLTADVTDNVRVVSVTLHHRPLGSSDEYQSISMVRMTADQWSATIPGSAVQPPGVEYYIVASDGISQVYDGTAALPHSVIVTNVPTLSSVTPNHGPTTGGTSVTLSGVLFQDGASVLFGGVLASDIVVLSANQITCTTPPHFPAMVDVKIVNPDETETILLSGFQYRDEGVVLSMPVTSGDYGTYVELALSAENVTGLRAVDVTVAFDAGVLSAQSATNGTLTSGWSISANTSTAGSISLSLASPSEVSGTGTLARITFEVVGTPPASTALTIDSAVLNEGAVTFDLSHGSFVVSGFFAISGSVSYFGGGSVPDADLSMVGIGSYSDTSDAAGDFSIANVPTGSYTLTPSKSNDVNEITAFDASLVLQAAADLRSLSTHETLAADVSRNGTVSSMDASYILEKAVGLLEVPFPGAGKVWDFDPSERTYPLLNGDQSGQDFTAVLIGDVSGNWKASSTEGHALGLSLMGPGGPNVKLTMPSVAGEIGGQVVLPVEAELHDVGLYSVDLAISYDTNSLFVESVAAGEAAEGMMLAVNSETDGQIRIGLAGAEPVTDDGTLVEISFEVLEVSDSPVPVSFLLAKVNEGSVETSVQNGYVATKVSLADFDGNRIVNLPDFAALASAWLSGPGDLNWDPACDISQPPDDFIDGWDLAALAEDWL